MSDFHPVGFRLMALSSAHVDTRDLLPEIRVPTLLVWGDADARSPMSVAHQFHDAIPGAKLAVIPGAGHVSNFESTGAVQCRGAVILPVWLGRLIPVRDE
jgi:pimeloyl-ACP methyl ester carboxylesterase